MDGIRIVHSIKEARYFVKWGELPSLAGQNWPNWCHLLRWIQYCPLQFLSRRDCTWMTNDRKKSRFSSWWNKQSDDVEHANERIWFLSIYIHTYIHTYILLHTFCKTTTTLINNFFICTYWNNDFVVLIFFFFFLTFLMVQNSTTI